MNEDNTFSKKMVFAIAIYTILIFIVFFSFLFPLELFENHVKSLILKKIPRDASIVNLSIKFPSKIVIEGINYKSKNKVLKINQIEGNFLWYKIFIGKLCGKFLIDAYDGLLSGEFSQSLFQKQKRSLLVDIKNLDASKIDLLSKSFGMSIGTKITLDLKSKWHGMDLKSLEGEWEFKTDKGSIKPKNFPKFNFDEIDAKGLIRSGVVHIQDGLVKSKEISAIAKGEVVLKNKISNSMVDLRVKLKIEPKFKKKLGVIASFLPKEAKDGYLNINIKGPANNLHYSSK